MDNGVITLTNSFQNIPIDENFKLIAGPGAGKTTFLVNHIKNVIKTSDKLKNGRKILCITYTNVAVDTIKENGKVYAYLINGDDDTDFMIRILEGEEYLPIKDKNEFDLALMYYMKKHKDELSEL